ncbi:MULTISPECIES: ABC transporter substrate-binding protein [unclassified Microbacterium]|uniref:ABC transporter substrate-binding protein n=1 Tax=Microbacterium TaxID=33882 RepID=UPI003B9FB078
MQKFHIAATGHSLNYLPEYIADRHGLFAAQGLQVTAEVPRPWDDVLKRLRDDAADAALGGIWVPSMYLDRVRRYTAFAQVANRAPLALLGRAPEAGRFDLADLRGRTVLMKGSNGASVGLFLKMLLREQGIEPREVDYIQDLDGTMLSELFVGGMGDYLVIDNLSARVLADRHDHVSVVLETVVESGDIPWSVYYRESEGITPDIVNAQERFCFALQQAMDWILANDAEAFRDDLMALFPKAPADILVSLANVFREHRMWTTPTIDRAGYERWQQGIADGFLIQDPLPYEALVDEGPASGAAGRRGRA